MLSLKIITIKYFIFSFPPPQMPASTSNTLYPNIQEHRILENNQFVQRHVQPPCAPNLDEFP